MEHLFKLKKDGKTVGYLKFEKVDFSMAIYLTQKTDERWYPLWKMHYEGSSHSYEYLVGNKSIYVIFDSIHSFVTKDKHGNDVFAGDLIKAIISDVSNSPLIGRIIPNKNPLSCWMFKYRFEGKEYLAPAPDLQDIELIEEKEDE